MQKIAILGGGLGSLATAFELTDSENWEQKYEITIYQMGWRLGGKGASGRNPARGNRIEEHGLHILMGFYDNAFVMLKQAYKECDDFGLTPNTPFRSYLDAFQPMNLIVHADDGAGEGWEMWHSLWPPNGQRPGELATISQNAVSSFALWVLQTALERVLQALGISGDRKPDLLNGMNLFLGRDSIERFLAPIQGLASIHGFSAHVSSILGFAFDAVWDEAAGFYDEAIAGYRDRVAALLDQSKFQENLNLVQQELRDIFSAVDQPCRALLQAAEGFIPICGPEFRRHLLVADTALTILRGMINDDLLGGDFSRIEHLDFLEWMERHDPVLPERAAFIRSFYDAAFAYRDGRPAASAMSFAAGTMLYGSIRLMFTYRGSIMWRMSAGMGETIFTPLYCALEKRGVKFAFFHKVTDLVPSEAGDTIDEIKIDVQAKVRDGVEKYEPLERVPTPGLGDDSALLCWPIKPLFDQLANASELQNAALRNGDLESWWTDCEPVDRITLKRGTDFHKVVLGTALGTVPHICKKLLANPAWDRMVQNVKLVRTQAAQVWLSATPDRMGWNSSEPPLLCSFVEPFDTWADMTHLVKSESLGANAVQVAYLCNAAPNDPDELDFSQHDYPSTQMPSVVQRLQTFLDDDSAAIWPEARLSGNPAQFDQDIVVETYTRLNIDPSELYVQSVPGSTAHRLSARASAFDNLFLAGDWTKSMVNIGCVEAAVISGKVAAAGILGKGDVKIHGCIGVDLERDL